MKRLRFSIRAQLFAVIVLDLTLMLALGSFAIYQMSEMNERASFVEQTTIPSLDLSDKINGVITQYRSYQLEYIVNISPADKDRIEVEMQRLETLMDEYFAAYDPLINTAAEQASFDLVQARWAEFVVATRERFLPSARLTNTGNVQPAFNRLNPLYDDLVIVAEALNRESQAQATGALEAVQSSFRSSRLVILSETILTIVLSALIGMLLSGRIAKRIKELTRAAKSVAEGDLHRAVDARGRDELATLAVGFNSMVANLREQRALVDQRNQELQTSLARQQQLTEDVLRGKQAEAIAEQARVAAEETSRAKTMFLATMSHELRTPLNAILGYTQLLQMQATMAQNAETPPSLERIQLAGKHLLSLVDTILDFAKVEQGKMETDPRPVAVAGLVEEVAGIIEPLAHERGNRLSVDCPSSIGIMETDGGKLRQILFNLLSNAAKFTEQGTIVLCVREENRPSHPNGSGEHAHYQPSIVFAVIDNGIGITTEQQRRLFQPFSQADSSTTRQYGGTGLGLALSQQLCKLLGGRISVESEVGRGSTFTVVLPRNLAKRDRPAESSIALAAKV